MGANVSQNYMNNVQSSFTNVITNVLDSYMQSTNSSTSIQQTFNFINEKDANVYCDMNVTQFVSSNQNITSILDSQTQNAISDELTTKLTDKLAALTQQQNSGLNLAQLNDNQNYVTAKNFIANNIQTTLSSVIQDTMNVNTGVAQQINIHNYGNIGTPGQTCNFTQSTISQIIASQTASVLIKNAVKNHVVNVGSSDVSLTTDQSNVGLSLFGIIGVLVAIVLVIGGMMYFGGETVKRYIIPIGIIALIVLLALIGYFSYKKEMTPDIVAIVGFVVVTALLGYTYYSNKKAGIPSFGKGHSKSPFDF